MLLQMLHRLTTGLNKVDYVFKLFCLEILMIFLCSRMSGFIVISIYTISYLLNKLTFSMLCFRLN
jgi:hypothetical protein